VIATRSGKPITDRFVRSALAFACEALVVTMFVACTIEPCPEHDSPCPEPFEVHDWCGDDRCEVDGMRAHCDPGGCDLVPDQILTIPIADFESALVGKDLAISFALGGCGETGDNPTPGEVAAAIDGESGTPWTLENHSGFTFRWESFPKSPGELEVTYSGPTVLPCTVVQLRFIDASCEAENPGPTDCVQ